MKKLNLKLSKKAIEKFKETFEDSGCIYFMVGGVGKDFLDLIKNPIRKVWKCSPN